MENSYTLYRDKKPFYIKDNYSDTIESYSGKINELYDIGQKNTNDINECKLYIKKLNRYKWISGLKTKRRRRY